MTRFDRVFLNYALAVAAIGIAAAFAVGGSLGALGMAIGLSGAAVGVTALWAVVSFVSAVGSTGLATRLGMVVSILGFFLKLPLFYLLWSVAKTLDGAAPVCFLTGVILVYFAFGAWAAARSGDAR